MPYPARVIDVRRAARCARESHQSSGFTLLEILIVVTIIGVLMAIVAPRFIKRAEGARREMALVQVNSLSGTIDMYRIDNGSYPTTDQGLDALVSAPSSGPHPRRYPPGGYVNDRELLDPDHSAAGVSPVWSGSSSGSYEGAALCAKRAAPPDDPAGPASARPTALGWQTEENHGARHGPEGSRPSRGA
jgi:general secretion pathway protein G